MSLWSSIKGLFTRAPATNVKPGDLARVLSVKETMAMVEVLRACRDDEDQHIARPAWRCCLLTSLTDDNGIVGRPGFSATITDRVLRKLRDDPGADETLSWAPLPQPMTERQEA